MISLLFFIFIVSIISYIDIKKELIPDKIMFPSLLILSVLKYYENSLHIESLIAVVIILVIFVIPIVFNMAFGGGDLRFGAFCALFLGLAPLGYFVMFSGVAHILLLAILKKKSFAFAPAMSIGAISAYIIGNL